MIHQAVSDLIFKLDAFCPAETPVIQWGAPIPAFGNAYRSRVATLGLNPSNREFVDTSGQELDGTLRRFHSLRSLGLSRWNEANNTHVAKIILSCKRYFQGNPYDTWFRQLDHLLSGISASYYGDTSTACHLDLVPYATSCKWTSLTKEQRAKLVHISRGFFTKLLKHSPIKILVLNGRSVVKHFETISEFKLKMSIRPEWALNRGSNSQVLGYSYCGIINRVANDELNRDILVLGFNHNIQSSFGVTQRVRDSIRDWITEQAKEMTP